MSLPSPAEQLPTSPLATLHCLACRAAVQCDPSALRLDHLYRWPRCCGEAMVRSAPISAFATG